MPLPPQFDQVFQLLPTPTVLLLPDAPKFTIVAVNNAYLGAVNFPEEDLIGKGIFEAFPENKVSNGVENLKNSLKRVIVKQDPHRMPLQKYDIPICGTTKFKVKYANVQNIPVKNANNSITHILHSVEDVTDKKNLEIAFETERQRFSDLYLQASSCMGILKGPNHVYEIANPTYLQLINKKNIIGKSYKELRPESAEFIEILNQVYKTGISFSAKEKPVKLDKEDNGEIIDIYVDTLLQPHKDNTGKTDGIFFFFIDVTEKVKSRKKIEESEKRYRELIENLPVATYSCDPEGRILLYNKAAAVLWGKEPEIGKDLWCGFWSIYSENGTPLPLDLCPMAMALKKGRKITDQKIIVERPNGDKLNVVTYPVPFMDSSGRVTGAVNVLIDITARKKAKQILKESEKKYRQIVETAQEGIWLVDEDNKTIFVNNKLCEILGYNRTEMIGKAIFTLMDAKGKNIVEKLLLNKEDSYTRQSRFKFFSKSGKEIWTRISANPLFDEVGIYKGSLAMVTDITESKKADEKLGKLNKELAYQNREKEIRAAELTLSNKELEKTNIELDRFVYSVSHDLRSPLTSILGLVSLIEEDSREPDTLEQVKMIRTSIHRLDGFIKNILNYSQNNRTGLEKQKIPIKKTIHEIVDYVCNIKGAEGISFQVDIDEKQPFYSDWQRFHTILENLISNAINYHTKEVSGRYLKLTGTSDEKELKLSISDNGIGIEAAYHAKIFNMFYRIPGTIAGSGFGLYIVKETLEKLHGTIEIQSEKGVGTTFIISLKNLKE
jgi:PAS domain S-box-containing protein